MFLVIGQSNGPLQKKKPIKTLTHNSLIWICKKYDHLGV